MTVTDWQQSFFTTTRGQVFAQLRAGPKTVDDLAAAVGLTDNGVRVHLIGSDEKPLVWAQ